MKIIGIDSSTRNCGVAIYDDNKLIFSCAYPYTGVYSIEKLRLICADFSDLIQKHQPDALLIEETIPVRNGRAVTSLNQVAGAIMAIGFEYGATVGTIPPTTIKRIMEVKDKFDSVSKAMELHPELNAISDDEADAILVVETYFRMQKDAF